MSRIAIIVALEREIGPFVEGWTRGVLHLQGEDIVCYRNGDLMAVAGGIGCRQAESAARAAVAEFQPQALVSAGLGGAVIRTLKAGSVFVPNVIVDEATGAEYRCNAGAGLVSGGVLVSAKEIAGPGSKKHLADQFHALVVDMEAAAVARVAREMKTGFFCVKAISDELDSRLPPMNRFVDETGRFQNGNFLAWAAVRPQWWPATIRLARDSRRATRALSDWLGKNLTGSFVAPAVVTLDGADSPKP
jgi:adenosylhomocysteine nucleosidase